MNKNVNVNWEGDYYDRDTYRKIDEAMDIKKLKILLKSL